MDKAVRQVLAAATAVSSALGGPRSTPPTSPVITSVKPAGAAGPGA